MRVVVFGALNGALAMGLGAFSANILSGPASSADPQTFQTAVIFHLIVSAVMIAVGGLKGYMLPSLSNAASWFLGLGIALYAGGTYGKAFGALDLIDFAIQAGGVLTVLGFLILAVGGARRI